VQRQAGHGVTSGPENLSESSSGGACALRTKGLATLIAKARLRSVARRRGNRLLFIVKIYRGGREPGYFTAIFQLQSRRPAVERSPGQVSCAREVNSASSASTSSSRDNHLQSREEPSEVFRPSSGFSSPQTRCRQSGGVGSDY